jgi:hypothetical protein
LARYTLANSGRVPETGQIYDWQSLRKLINRYAKTPLPATEAEAGFTFVKYNPEPSLEDYSLLVELHNPQNGFNRVEVSAYGVDPVK